MYYIIPAVRATKHIKKNETQNESKGKPNQMMEKGEQKNTFNRHWRL